MLLRQPSRPLLVKSLAFLAPAVILGITALAWRRRSHAQPPVMPRLPVRHPRPEPTRVTRDLVTSSSRLRRLSAPAPEVDLPETFWDARAEEDDPAEIPSPSSPLVGEASQSAAGIAPGAFYDSSWQLRW